MEKVVIENDGTAFQESSGPDVKKGCETEKHPSLSKTTMDKEKRKEEERTREAAQWVHFFFFF